jgi:hypothetical protein
MEQQGRDLWFKYPPRAGPCLARSHLWTEELKKTQALWSSVQKGTQSKGNRPGAESKGHQGSEVTAFAADIPGRKCSILGERWLGRAQAPSPPHKLSLLEVVLAPSSVSRAQSRRSQFSGTLPSVPSIQGWAAIWSREGLSEGLRERHHSISCWHSAERTGGQSPAATLPCPQHGPSQLLQHTWGDPPPEKEPAAQDLLILLKGNVPTHHVVEQYTQRPHSGRPPVISVISDPLWGAVHTGA